MTVFPLGVGKLHTCPCCGYPTLKERHGWEICSLCFWEDDGQDDGDADEVRGGPNQAYSLTAARKNFEEYLGMYPPDEDPCVPAGLDRKLRWERRRRIKEETVAAFEAMLDSNSDEKLLELWRMAQKGFDRM